MSGSGRKEAGAVTAGSGAPPPAATHCPSTSGAPPRRPGIDALLAYRDAGGGTAIELSDNTNRFGVPPAAAAGDTDCQVVHRTKSDVVSPEYERASPPVGRMWFAPVR